MNRSLISIKAERRCIAVAVFRGGTLRYAEVLTLSSDPRAAENSAVGFVNRNVERFEAAFAVLEDAVTADESRSASLIAALERAIAAQGVPTHRIGKLELFLNFAVRPLKTRKELHTIIVDFWPQLNSSDFHSSIMDAAAAGLFVQTEHRLLG
jgi:hypothetical protein